MLRTTTVPTRTLLPSPPLVSDGGNTTTWLEILKDTGVNIVLVWILVIDLYRRCPEGMSLLDNDFNADPLGNKKAHLSNLIDLFTQKMAPACLAGA